MRVIEGATDRGSVRGIAILCCWVLTMVIAILPTNTEEPKDTPAFRTLVKKHCVQCHGAEKQKGDVRLDNLPLTNLTPEHLEIWQSAVDQVTGFDMPPDDDLALSDEMITNFAGFLKPVITEGLANVTPEQVVLRRLNKVQYSNTVRDLFGINVTVDDPAASLPPDEESDGFDNLGSALTVSDLHLDAYMAAADDVVSRWAARAAAVPESFRIEAPAAPGSKHKFDYGRGVPFTEDYFDLMHSGWTNRRFKTFTFPAKDNNNCLLPHAGVYRITVDVETMHTNDPRGITLLKTIHNSRRWLPDPSHTPQLGFFLRRPSRSITPNIDQRVATFELEHNERKTMTREVWLPGGQYTLAVNFDTGPVFEPAQIASRFWAGDSEEKYSVAMEALKRNNGPASEIRANIASLPLPRMRFHSIVIEGPIKDPDAPDIDYLARLDEDLAFQQIELRRFAGQIFRRPVSEDELAPYQAYAKEKGLQAALKAMLCSPSFLYLRETTDQLDDYALANRLSYFLWNSMPDQKLFILANKGELSSPNVLRKEVDRLLEDEKAQSFITRFTHQWLGLGNMDDMPADRNYTYFHDFFVKNLFKEETNLFFEHLLKTNAPASELVHADYTFMNAPLARHYGIEGIKGSQFERVSLASLPRRRGLLGQGAILTTSANGIDTSPVIRGIWVLEHLLGTPPSPPPPDVEVLEPDTRGTVSIREMYAAHREDASCMRCHEDIDPLGFALENFDPVGQWRDEYEGGLKVDSYGQMPNGEKFEDIVGLRALLKGNAVDQIAEHLFRRMMVCATGRELTVSDDSEIDSILKINKVNNYPIKDLLFSVISSEIFSRK